MVPSLITAPICADLNPKEHLYYAIFLENAQGGNLRNSRNPNVFALGTDPADIGDTQILGTDPADGAGNI